MTHTQRLPHAWAMLKVFMLKRLQANILPLLLIALLVLVILNQLVFTPLILRRGDTYNYFYPYWQARDMAFSAGNLPLWTHNIFMGAPLLAIHN
jgi:hypothetical protein